MKDKYNILIFIGIFAIFVATALFYMAWNAVQVDKFVVKCDVESIAVNEEYQLEFECYLNNGELATPEQLQDIQYTWMASSDRVSIDQNTGIITGISEGGVNISIVCEDEWSGPILIYITK